MLRSAILAFAALAAPIGAAGTEGPALRISGSPADAALIDRLWRDYRKAHPGARLSTSLKGPESTLAGVYTGTADIAFMAREIREPMERMAFQWALLTPPAEIEIATAGLSADRPNAQLAVFVNAANPVAGISLDQIDGVLSAERKRGGVAVTDWAQLGGRGGAIRPYGPPVESIDALFIRRLVMKDTRKWVTTYQVRPEADLVKAVAADPAGFAIAPYRLNAPGVRMVPVIGPDGRPVALTAASAADRSYPLARSVRVIVHKPKDGPVAPAVADFLRFVLSPQGQQSIAAEGSYLPLAPALAAEQAGRIG